MAGQSALSDPGCMQAIGDNCKNLRVLSLVQGSDRRTLDWAYVLRKIGDGLRNVWIFNADRKVVEFVRKCRGMESVMFTGVKGGVLPKVLKNYVKGMGNMRSFRVERELVELF
jgi:hypothetical protein